MDIDIYKVRGQINADITIGHITLIVKVKDKVYLDEKDIDFLKSEGLSYNRIGQVIKAIKKYKKGAK